VHGANLGIRASAYLAAGGFPPLPTAEDHALLAAAIRADPWGPVAQQVLEAIRTLPDTYRETLILRLVEGMTGPEIAARTCLTHGSVRVNLHRGMQQLRELLGHKTEASDSQASSTPS
jgi:RNA polymerase sigma-70 factor (ECF subfamily)